jgi:hypothetical protein
VDMIRDNSVFQGTVLGPSLWNDFFGDMIMPGKFTGGREGMFADDLHIFQKFDRRKTRAEQDILQKCRVSVHKWGKANRVSFDPSKNHLDEFDLTGYHGAAFKFPRCMDDNDLTMVSVIDLLITKFARRLQPSCAPVFISVFPI